MALIISSAWGHFVLIQVVVICCAGRMLPPEVKTLDMAGVGKDNPDMHEGLPGRSHKDQALYHTKTDVPEGLVGRSHKDQALYHTKPDVPEGLSGRSHTDHALYDINPDISESRSGRYHKGQAQYHTKPDIHEGLLGRPHKDPASYVYHTKPDMHEGLADRSHKDQALYHITPDKPEGLPDRSHKDHALYHITPDKPEGLPDSFHKDQDLYRDWAGLMTFDLNWASFFKDRHLPLMELHPKDGVLYKEHVKENPCASAPCRNAGVCSTSEDPWGWGFYCTCKGSNYGGKLCQIEKPCDVFRCPAGYPHCHVGSDDTWGRFCYTTKWVLLEHQSDPIATPLAQERHKA